MDMSERDFPGLYARYLGSGISWTFYKHWGQCVWAGEHRLDFYGDRSWCLQTIDGRNYANVPIVAQARVYKSIKGEVSAVYSYPGGLGLPDYYFWEIWSPDLMEDVERFDTEQEMESRIIELLSEEE